MRGYTGLALAFATMFMTQAGSAEPVALRHVRVVDGLGGAPLEGATLSVEDGLIAAIGSDGAVKVPGNARVIDLAGKTVLPGLISNHSHVGLVDGVTVGPQNYTRENIERQLRQFRAYGVTTVTSLGLNRPLFQEVRDAAHAGVLPGADLFGADRGIGVVDGAPPVNAAADQLYRPVDPEQARDAVRAMAGRRADLIKIWVDDFHHVVPAKMRADVYKAAIDEAHKQGVRVAAHVYYLEDAKSLVAAGADVLAHGVRDTAVDDALIVAMKAAGTWYVPTLDLDESFFVYAERPAWMNSPFFRHALQPALAKQLDDPAWRAKTLEAAKKVETDRASFRTNLLNFRRLYDAGVKIGFGTDSGATPLRIPGFAEHRELELMTEAGVTPLQAIGVATRNAAELLRLRDRGVLLPGRRADLLVVDGDPSRNIKDLNKVESVWQRGEQVSGPIPNDAGERNERPNPR